MSSAAQNISVFDKCQGVTAGFRGIVFAVTNHKRELFYGLIRIHVLLHAAQEPIFGLGMMEELAHHGYRIGPGTLYPLLHGMERAGLLRSVSGGGQGRRPRVYGITAAGKKALAGAKEKVDELHRELHEATPRRVGAPQE
ncbi:MAG TPA: helix-turn-helix transcriptional regulator [Terracidiphilus sp.]|nr:helix-turn-helix transcriptional regulator [Terracidiphilus sp.]